MKYFPRKIFSDLASKPIFSDSGWIKSCDLNSETNNVAADLFCPICQKEKTFTGKAYSQSNCRWEFYRICENIRQQAVMPYGGNIRVDGESDISKAPDEIALTVDDTVTVQIRCPSCGNKAYICYRVEIVPSDIKGADVIRVTKIGEYPNQEISRLQTISKYIVDFPVEHGYLAKAEKAFYTGLGTGAVIYLRKAYETVIHGILDEHGINYGPPKRMGFMRKLAEADRLKHIIPDEMKGHDYGLFGDMSEVVHGETDDTAGMGNYELLRDVFRMILDNIMQERENQKLIKKISPNPTKQGGAPK